MEQLNLSLPVNSTTDIAHYYFNEILDVLKTSMLGYDLSQVTIEHREPESGEAYDTILMFNRPCFHIKGKKTKYLYLNSLFVRLLEKTTIPFEPSTNSRWARLSVSSFVGFSALSEPIEELYEVCLRDSDTFGCCGSYDACSDAGHCIKTDIMFAGKCAYRQNLKAGKIFYGKNKNI